MGGPRVLLAVTGSIAAYKACEVVRRLQDRGVDVRVTMTPNAAEFVSPLTFAALSGHRVLSSSFDDDHPERIPHVRWGEECDAFCVAPASADFIAKMALGLADDFPSTVHLAVEGPVLAAPAMEDAMWLNEAVQANVRTLRARGATIIEPATGPLASGRHGPGRLAEPADIVEAVMRALMAGPADRALDGLNVLVTAGPTREHFDPVRVFTNPSTGKMGYALAESARRSGAKVTLVSGPTQLPDPSGIDTVPVVDAEQMRTEVLARAEKADVVVMAAAVSDFRPSDRADEKLKKGGVGDIVLNMERTPDILMELHAVAGERTVVGFAAETSDLEARAREKLERKGCDLIVGNLVGKPTSGFGSDANEVVICDRLGASVVAGPAAKIDIAAAVWKAIVGFRQRLAVASPREDRVTDEARRERVRAQLLGHLQRLQQEGLWGLAASPAARVDGEATQANEVAAASRPSSRGEDAGAEGGRLADEQQTGLFGESPPAAGTFERDETLESVGAEARQCVACRLHETRNSVVFGVGSPNARLMFIGEGPGRDEDLQGEPFVGRAGQLLTKIIRAMGYEREDVYIANAVKCRPPQNRDPQADEVGSCRHFLMRQIAAIKPEIIVLLGRSAVQAVLELSLPLSRLRGQYREWNGTRVMCTYHPAYLLRNPSAKGMVWEDMKIVRDTLAGGTPE